MNALVLGAGIVGRAAAWDLARRGYEVVVADRSRRAADEVADEVGAAPSYGDVGDAQFLTPLLGQADLVVAAIPYWFGMAVARAAIEHRTHYFDFGGNPDVVAEQLTLDEAARSADVAVVPDCGLGPGLANVLAADCMARLGDKPVRELKLRVGALPQEPVGPLGYQLAFSPYGLINEYAQLCVVLANGEVTTVEPLTGFEEIEWNGWGPLEAFHTAGGSSILPERWAGRVETLDYKTLRYPGHGSIFVALRELGMFDEAPESSRREVLVEALLDRLPSGRPDLVLVRVWASSQEEREEVGYQLEDLHDGTFSALARTTAFPTTAIADLIAAGKVATRGVTTMGDAVDATTLLPELKAIGLEPVSW